MKFSDFYKHFPDETICISIVKTMKEQEGLICKKCDNDSHYWKRDKKSFECKECNYRTSLKSGTIMENSNLPLRYWLSSISFLKVIEQNISALALQKEFGHKRYEPIWRMLKKIKNSTKSDFLIKNIHKYINLNKQIIHYKNNE